MYVPTIPSTYEIHNQKLQNSQQCKLITEEE